ncbi:histidine kinase [Aquincola sp. S2]|uniref:histidine kinase n=1 Tax=Pseudaquabacterium terrae TaxID=2732868 RepID=A0ABX2EMN2_9BURK|nr:ATP-binding protein [Aquabacterium terrae]NRF69823.1 histidine kinase [Aquabacterium terrae]
MQRLLHTLILAVTLFAGLLAPTQAKTDVITLREAQARLEPAGLPPQQQPALKLSHRWDEAFPGRDGRALYTLALPAGGGDEPMALLFTRVGNQVEVRVNGRVVARFGELGKPRFDAAKTTRLVPVPAVLLQAEGNRLEVEVTTQASRWGGLSLVQYGPASTLAEVLADQLRWRHHAALVLVAGFALMGALSLALWHRQREPLYGWFGLAALLGVVRHLDRIWSDVPVPWPAWGAITAAAYAAHLVTIIHVGALMVDATGARLRRSMAATLVVSAGLGIVALLLHKPLLWDIGLVAMVPYGVAVVIALGRVAWARGGAARWLLAAVALLLLTGSAHDLGVRLGWWPGGGGRLSVMPFATFLIALGMFGLIAQRHNRTVLDYRQLNDELAQRVQQREDELRQALDTLHLQQREQAVLEERQRTMRELHDGVGAQLVALLNLASQGPVDAALVQEQAKLALDEMRMAVDALQPMNGDLTTVLATLRYRLQPRLAAAGIAVDWDMPPLPPLAHLTPHSVLQVQRILLEAVTNVLKHAAASRIRVSARLVDTPAPAIEMSLHDDGRGLQPGAAPPHAGRGLANMQARAQAIGASLVVESTAPRGTRVCLRWPLPPAVA